MVVAAFLGSFSNSFTWHDRPLMNEVSRQSLSDAPGALLVPRISPDKDSQLQYRPVPYALLMLDQFLWGDDGRWRRVENLILHYIVVLMFYFLILKAFGDIRVALFSAMLFALHPLAVEPVNSVMARDAMLAALFLMISILALLKAGPGKSRWGFVAMFAFALSVLSLEIALLACVFLTIMFFLQGGGFPRIKISAIGAFLLVAVAYYSFRLYFHGNETSYEFLRPAFWDTEHFGYSLSATYEYLVMLTVPFSLNVGHAINPVEISSFQAIISMSVIGVLLAIALFPWSAGALRFSSIWLIVFSLPFLGSIPYSSLHLSDRYVYLALPGLCLLCGWHINALLVRNRYFGSLLLSGALVILAVETHKQSIVWTDDFTLWDRAVKKSPSSAYANYNMGRIHDEIDARAKAIIYYDAAISADPMYFKPHFGLGTLYKRVKRYNIAVKHYSLALIHDPGKIWINLSLGDVYTEMQQWDRAIYSYSRYLEENPRDPTAHHRIAIALQGKGDYEGALKHYNEALSSWPGYAKAHFDFSQLLLKINDRENARHELKLALLIKPEYSEARMLLNELEEKAP